MLTLKNFELQISNTLIHRGREYYENNAVADLDETEKGLWYAEVTGSDTYSVELKLSAKNEIKRHACDCPYDGDICKHVVAVLFLLREQLTPTAIPKKVTPKADFGALLKKISLEEYQEFIRIHAAKDKEFKSLFERHFASKDSNIDVGRSYTRHLQRLIRGNSGEGFIDYRASRELSREINKLLDEAQLLIKKNDFRNAFIVVRSVLTEVIEIMYIDDSNGYIGNIIYSAIELLRVIAETEAVAVDLQEEVYDFVQAAASRSEYSEYGDSEYEIADIYQALAIRLNKQQSYLNFIDAQLKKASEDEDSYSKEEFIVQKIAFLRAIGNVEDAQMLIQHNLEIVGVRLEQVNYLIEKKDFASARRLIAEGIAIAKKKGHAGRVKEWEEELLRIAVLENDKKLIRHYTKQFAFDEDFDVDTDYYNQWKNTFTIAEWEEEIETYLEERIAAIEVSYKKDKGRTWHSLNELLLDELAPIYIAEKYWDRLFALVSKEVDLDRLLEYHEYLSKIYPLQLLTIYLPAFQRKADVVGNRSQYTDLAEKMKMVMKSIPEGKSEIIAVAEEMSLKYPRRPAMIEELNKVIKMGR